MSKKSRFVIFIQNDKANRTDNRTLYLINPLRAVHLILLALRAAFKFELTML